MVPKVPPPAATPAGTPAFLARVMALPALDQAINTFYTTGESNAVVGAALRAAERSVRVAATSALPLANPLVERVGGWAVLDEWACRGLDRVEKAVPIINLPAEEIVDKTKKTVLGIVAGDKVIVPPTLLEAVRARANRVVDQFADTPVMKRATGLAENTLDVAERYLENVLPRGKGDRRQSLVPSDDVVSRAVLLGQRASHRVYRAAVRRMRPDLTYDPQATITLDMVVNYTRTAVLDQLSELARQPERDEEFGVVMSVVRWPIRTTSTLTTSLATTYDTLAARGVQLADVYLPSVTVSVSRARASATHAAQRLTVIIRQPGVLSRQAIDRMTPLVQEGVDLLRERLGSAAPLLQTHAQVVRKQTLQLITLLQKAVADTTGPLLQARTDLLGQRLAELLPAVQATLQALQDSAVDVAAILGESLTALLPLLQKTLDTVIGSLMLDAETQLELKEMMAKAAQEARVWRSAGFVALRMAPSVMLYGSQLTRRITTQILREVVSPTPTDTTTTTTTPTTTPTTTTTATTPKRLNLVPVKVTMLMPKKDKKNLQEAPTEESTKHDKKTKQDKTK